MPVELSWNDEIVRDGSPVVHLHGTGGASALRCFILFCIALHCVALYCICFVNGLSIRYLVKKDEINLFSGHEIRYSP